MAGTQAIEDSAEATMPRTIQSLSFRTPGPDDNFIGLCNEFARLPANEGIAPTAVLRNFFCRKLKEAIIQAQRLAGDIASEES